MTTLNEQYEFSFKRKQDSCKSRGIKFLLSLNEYVALMNSRSTMRCSYSGRKFNMTDYDHKDYPTMERVKQDGPYSRSNTIWVTSQCNKLKDDFIDKGLSMKGIGAESINLVQRIKKFLNKPHEEIMQPYYDLYDFVEQQQAEKDSRDIELQNKVNHIRNEQTRLEKEAVEKARVDEIKTKVYSEVELAKHYIKQVEGFEKFSKVYELTIKTHRDIVRKTKCSVSGEKFGSLNDKWLWVIDKSKPLGKDNLLVVTLNMSNTLDLLQVACGGDNKVMLKGLQNLSKII